MQRSQDIDEFSEHFWSPSYKKFVDYSWTFDFTKRRVVSSSFLPDSVQNDFNALSASEQNKILSQVGQRLVTILFALETFALSCYSKIAIAGRDVGLELCEEARHASSLATYLDRRWKNTNVPVELANAFDQDFSDCENSEQLEKLIQFIEAVNAGLLTALHLRAHDPLLVRICSFIIADEADHNALVDQQPRSRVPSKFNLSEELNRTLIDTLINSVRTHSPSAPDADLSGSFLLEVGEHFHSEFSTPCSDNRSKNYRDVFIQIGSSSKKFLAEFKKSDDPMPDEQLALDWLMAGIAGTAHWNLDDMEFADVDA
jgi:hypothetical protein